jgi:carboxypeptidase family protein
VISRFRCPGVVGKQIGSVLLVFAVAGQAWAATSISGKVTAPSGTNLTDVGASVVATSDKFKVFKATVNDDGTYSIDSPENGTYTVAVLARGLAADTVKNVVINDTTPTATQDFTLKERAPVCIVKSANPIPLTDGIDAASFQDAPEIALNSGENVAVGDATTWGGPTTVSGRFKMKYSSLGIHVAGDVTFKTPRVNNQTDGNIWNGNALEIDFQNDKYDATRSAYDQDHNWQLAVSLGDNPSWWLFGGIQATPGEDLTSHFAIQDKTTKDGETFRLDIPWSILLDSSGKAISAPADNDVGAIDIALDAADPTADRTTADRSTGFQLTWSGFNDTWTNPSSLVQIQFCPQPPAAGGGTGTNPTAGQ